VPHCQYVFILPRLVRPYFRYHRATNECSWHLGNFRSITATCCVVVNVRSRCSFLDQTKGAIGSFRFIGESRPCAGIFRFWQRPVLAASCLWQW
jgi:hypothetical protein